MSEQCCSTKVDRWRHFYSKKSCKKDFELEVLRRKPGCVPDSCLLALMYDEARLGCTCLALLDSQADIFLASWYVFMSSEGAFKSWLEQPRCLIPIEIGSPRLVYSRWFVSRLAFFYCMGLYMVSWASRPTLLPAWVDPRVSSAIGILLLSLWT